MMAVLYRMAATCFLLYGVLCLSLIEAKHFEYSKEHLPPIVLVPGLGGSQLDAKYVDADVPNCKYTNYDWFMLYLADDIALFNFDCIPNSLELIYNTTSRRSENIEGVFIRPHKFGTTEGVSSIDSMGAFSYFYNMIEVLKKKGYEEGKNLFGAPYDFRLSPLELEGYFNDFNELVEGIVKKTRMPVVLTVHSMGAPLLALFLNKKPDSWRKKHIESMVTFGGAWGGAVSALQSIISGPDIEHQETITPIIDTFPSVVYLLPDLSVWDPEETIVTIKDKKYGMKDIEFILNKLGLSSLVEIYRDQDAYRKKSHIAPKVPLHCLYGIHNKTVNGLVYNGLDTYPYIPRNVTHGDGDGTVNRRSLEMCIEFGKHQSEPITTKTFSRVDHLKILSDNSTLNYLANYVIEVAHRRTQLFSSSQATNKISSAGIKRSVINTNKIANKNRAERRQHLEMIKANYKGKKDVEELMIHLGNKRH